MEDQTKCPACGAGEEDWTYDELICDEAHEFWSTHHATCKCGADIHVMLAAYCVTLVE